MVKKNLSNISEYDFDTFESTLKLCHGKEWKKEAIELLIIEGFDEQEVRNRYNQES